MKKEPTAAGGSVLDTSIGPCTVSAPDGWGAFRPAFAVRTLPDGTQEIHLRLDAAAPARAPRFSLDWSLPVRDETSVWTPQNVHDELPLPWFPATIGANAARDLPLFATVGSDGAARLVAAASETVRRTVWRATVDEHATALSLSVSFFDEPEDPVSAWSARLRLDPRPRPFADAMREAAAWLDETSRAPAPIPVPEAAVRPWYSTWYAWHQALDAGAVSAEARRARALGMRGLLLDSGWDRRRPVRGVPKENPSKIGDWRPDPAKIPDMRALSDAVHAEGLAFAVWFALPFVGEYSRAWAKWKDKLLWTRWWDGHRVGIYDPRFPDVREHLASVLADAVARWNLDGVKIDFVDLFERPEFAPKAAPGAKAANLHPADAAGGEENGPADGRDVESVPRAVVRLLETVLARLRAVKPDVLVEFRQGYCGPAVRPYCNMLRASDCPACLAVNRFKTVDLRLTSGATPVHGDMLEWRLDAPAESGALQILSTLFAVPQVSVRLGDLPPRHRAMLRFWLRFWNEHRDTLLRAPLHAPHPEASYPVVSAAGPAETVTAVYQSGAVADAWQDGAKAGFVVNATSAPGLTVRFATRPKSVELFDCTGRKVASPPSPVARRSPLVEDVPVPPSGLLVARR